MTVARLCVIAALHDLGKFNQHFQNKGRPSALPLAGHRSRDRSRCSATSMSATRSSRRSRCCRCGTGVTRVLSRRCCSHRSHTTAVPSLSTTRASRTTRGAGERAAP
nr:hypothetical protein [Deltaproteobacteria bacterium]